MVTVLVIRVAFRPHTCSPCGYVIVISVWRKVWFFFVLRHKLFKPRRLPDFSFYTLPFVLVSRLLTLQ